MTYILGLLLFFITLGILVFVHELGHFLAAKSVGVHVEEFAIGFGPKLVTYLRRGGTDYTIRALPLGGFVSMVGMQPEDVSLPNGLMSKPAWARAWVFVAGPLMNVVLAFLVLCSMGMVTGVAKTRPNGDPMRSLQVVQVVPDSEAKRVGLRTGDYVVAIDGKPLKDGDELIQVIQSRANQKLALTVKRGNETLEMVATPKPEKLTEKGKTITVGKLGFMPGYIFERQDFPTSVRSGLEHVGGFFKMLAFITKRGELGESLGGPITMLRASNMNAQLPPGHQYSMVGQLSLSLAVFNLLPVPVLDGGHLAILLVEVLRRRRLGPEAHRFATAVGLVFIGALFVFLMYSDVTKWLKGALLQ